jgi:hypothetical protein
MASFIPPGRQVFLDVNSNPLTGGTVVTSIPGTSTPKTTYQDSAGTIANTNPIVLDQNGSCIILGTGAYREQVYDSSSNLVFDAVTGTPQFQDLQDNGGTVSIQNLAVTTNGTSVTPTAGDNSTKIATTAFVKAAVGVSMIQPTLYGLILSNDASNPNTVLDIALGGAVNSTGAVYMSLVSGTTKTFSNFAAGNGNGALDTGTKTSSTGYHVHLIATTSGTVDILFSLSATAPTLPSGYTYFVNIGWVYINSSGNIQLFTQKGNKFFQNVVANDYNATVSTTTLTITHNVPTGINVDVFGNIFMNSSTTAVIYFQSFYEVPFSGITVGNMYGTATQAAFTKTTNTLGQTKITSNTAGVPVTIENHGFIYPRGLQ